MLVAAWRCSVMSSSSLQIRSSVCPRLVLYLPAYHNRAPTSAVRLSRRSAPRRDSLAGSFAFTQPSIEPMRGIR